MKTRDCCTAVLLAVLLCAAAFARVGGGKLPKVRESSEIAVYATGALNESEKTVLGSYMLSALVNSGRFTAAERASEFAAEIGNAQVTQGNGIVDDGYIGRIAKQFGIRYVCVVGVSSWSGYYTVSARILDAETKKITAFGRRYGELNSTQALEALSVGVVTELGVGWYQPPPPPSAATAPPLSAPPPPPPPSVASVPPPSPPSAATAPLPVVTAPPSVAPAPPAAVTAPPAAPAPLPVVTAPPAPPPPAPVASVPPPSPPPAATSAPVASAPPPSPPPSATAPPPAPVATAPVASPPPAVTAPPPPPPPPPPAPEDVAANIIIHSVPDSADVYLGEKLIGKANQKLWMPSGTYELRFVKGDLEKTETITLKDGENPTKRVLLDDGKPTRRKTASEASAVNMSVGGGGFFASDFGGGAEYKAKGSFPYQGVNVSIDNSEITTAPWTGGGAFLFLDANYVEAFVGFTAGGGKWKQESKDNVTVNGVPNQSNGSDSLEADVSFSALNFGYLLKLPIALSDQITFFPAAGVDYQLSVGGKMSYTRELGGGRDTTITVKWDGKDGPDADYFSALMFKFGVGFDFGLTETIYLRSELLYGIRLASLIEKSMQSSGGYIPEEVEDQLDITGPRTRFGHGLTFKVGVGYMLDDGKPTRRKTASEASAVNMSVGGGGFFASDFGGGAEYKAKGSFPYQGVNVSIDNSEITTAPWTGGGAFLFLDANYVEAFVGFTAGGGTWKQESKDNVTVNGVPNQSNGSDSLEADVSFSALNFGYLLKLPIALSDQITFFPAAGIDYQLSVGGKMSYTDKTNDGRDTTITVKWDGKDGPDADYFSALMFKFGVGFDFGLTETIYLRSELLYGIRLASLIEKSMQSGGGGLPEEVEDQLDITGPRTRLGHGLTFKVGVGYKF